jgi:hypothetical protein
MRKRQLQNEINARFRDLSQYTKPRQISNTINNHYYPSNNTTIGPNYNHSSSSSYHHSSSSIQHEQNTTNNNNTSTFITNTSPIPIRYRKNSIPTSVVTDDDDDTVTPDSPPASCMEYIVPVVPTMDNDNFPSLPTPTIHNQARNKPKRSFSPSLNSSDQPRINRVLRIVPQKTINYQPNPYQSMTERFVL